ncbi:MAG: translocation/assembly module TamB domain-containing protein [Acidobacteriota bacterium]
MPENEVEQGEGTIESSENNTEGRGRLARRGLLSLRSLGIVVASLAFLALLLVLVVFISYRAGVFDGYIKAQLVSKFSDIGMNFDADVFRVTANPLEVELKNATFTDKITGEKLFFVRDAHLGLSIKDLYAWQLSRDISLDSTDVNGAEVWVRFDENGKSNFSNLHFVEGQGGRINFLYESVNFSLKDSVVHIGDLSRKIDANARNVTFFLEPQDLSVPDAQKRYKVSFNSTESDLSYDGHRLEKISVNAKGIADRNGAEISDLHITTPIGESDLNGTVSDWASLKYSLNVESNVDLTQASTLFPLGTAIRGVGNFRGTVSGEGETYKIDGKADTDSLTAAGVYLKGVNVEGTVQGTNSSYDANGTAVAQLLTFEDFRIEFPKLIGHIRGTGTDFRWVGELDAIAAKSPSMTLGGLFLSDAVAEYEDKHLTLSAGNGRAKQFKIGDTEFQNLTALNLKFSPKGDAFKITAPNARADSFSTKGVVLKSVAGSMVQVAHSIGRTDIEAKNLTSASAQIKTAKLTDVAAANFLFTDLPASTNILARNLRARSVNANGVVISGIDAPEVTLKDDAAETVIYSDKTRVAKIDAGSAVLGSLNVAGVRLTIRRGTISGTSDDIDAGDVQITKASGLADGGTLQAVKIARPVFMLEPSGRYRASADMSIGGGMVGQVNLGAAHADVDINNDKLALNNLTAEVMNGRADGTALIAMNDRSRSQITANFSNLDIGKLLALQGGRILPVNGETTGKVDLTFDGTNFRDASGTVSADISANAGTAESGLVPVNGRVELTGTNGLFSINQAKLNSTKTELSAAGRFDLKDSNSDLTVALNSTDASEVDRLIRVLGLSPELEQQLDSNQVALAGSLKFNGKITGNVTDPVINGNASLDAISMRGKELGNLTTGVYVSPDGINIKNGKLTESDGGNADFDIAIPNGGADNVTVDATFKNINAANLIAALPIADYLPAGVRDFTAQASGTAKISGLPNKAVGSIDLSSAAGSVSGQSFDAFAAKATFRGTLITLENLEIRSTDGYATAKGTYDRSTTAFNFELEGKNVQLSGLRNSLTQNPNIPAITGNADFTAKATGETDSSASYNVNFSGTANDVKINDNVFGNVSFKGVTANQHLVADLTADVQGHAQVINASVNFGDENMPFHAETIFDQSPLEPYFAFFPQLRGQPIGGTASGHLVIGGNLSTLAADGTRAYTTSNISGSADLTQLSFRFQDTPLTATEPLSVKFSPSEVAINNAKFAGGGSNMTVNGTIALGENGTNNFAIDGRINLNLLNLTSKDTFFAGFADVSVRLIGPSRTSVLSGTANIDNGSVSTFIGSDRITLDRIKTNIIFTSNQAQIERATGYLGGGKFVASGGALLNGLSLQEFRVDLNGNSVTIPLPSNFITTGDADLEVAGRRFNASDGTFDALRPLHIAVTGRIIARRSLYTKDIDLSNVVGVRRDTSLSSAGGGNIAPIKFDLTVDGRNALVVRNNIADLTASVSLHVTGDSDNPQVAGRITADSGTIFFRKDRYVVQRAVLEFPPETSIEPIINLQAETEIAGYQIFVNLAGPLNETDQMSAVVRSSPALPQADVVSLITTGSLSNNEGGIPTLAQTGINTAAEVLTDAIINNPARKATDKLFGLNVFEIDPILSGERLNPSARLTVGRQINNNLRITYSTNLSQDQNQVLAFEYRVSNKLSLVAQYEQRSLSNVTRNRDNFSFEIRFRRRF